MASLSENASFEKMTTEEDLTRHKGEAATSRRTTSMDHRLGSPALRKAKLQRRDEQQAWTIDSDHRL
ncbi:unnamed protein product [Angiostrongylus costaricensis]|uniref:Uncharacterized protein n=1 Tax=Angiostrongylus costaricensis TaxID=334426 RepID=A0A0R3PL91_ANGCS|nr:unnamed protein product [Angiostrongylus costaricensis]